MSQMDEVSLDSIVPADMNVRTDLGSLDELTQSIKDIGVKQPILLFDAGDEFQVFAGFRRYESAKMAGLESIPAVVYSSDEISSEDMLTINMVENIQRASLNVVDEANGYQTLKKDHGLTNKQIAAKVGMPVSRIRERLNVLKTPIREAG